MVHCNTSSEEKNPHTTDERINITSPWPAISKYDKWQTQCLCYTCSVKNVYRVNKKRVQYFDYSLTMCSHAINNHNGLSIQASSKPIAMSFNQSEYFRNDLTIIISSWSGNSTINKKIDETLSQQVMNPPSWHYVSLFGVSARTFLSLLFNSPPPPMYTHFTMPPPFF